MKLSVICNHFYHDLKEFFVGKSKLKNYCFKRTILVLIIAVLLYPNLRDFLRVFLSVGVEF
jgi:hypothetical protein